MNYNSKNFKNKKISKFINLFYINNFGKKLVFNGDSLDVVKYLLKNNFKNKVQLIYLDPPYGLNMDLVNKTNYSNSKPTFNDKWKDERVYINFLKKRVKLSKSLLKKGGSCFIQSSYRNLDLTLNIMNEIYGKDNLISIITFRKRKLPQKDRVLGGISDFLLWYSSDPNKTITDLKRKQKYSGALKNQRLTNIWNDTTDPVNKFYPAQTDEKIIKRCLMMATSKGDLIFDPMSGSGTTAVCAEKMQRKWIIADNSEFATSVALSRIENVLKKR